MPQIRNKLSENSTSRSETAFYAMAATLGDGWYVWMNRHLNFYYEGCGSMNREVDCILYHRDYGMLLVECKDGFITRHKDSEGCVVWQQNGRPMDRSPQDQVCSLTPPLHDYLKFTLGRDGYRVRIQWAVCFGDMENCRNIPNNEIPSQRIFLKSHMESAEAFGEKVLEVLNIPEVSCKGRPFFNDRLEDDAFERLVNFIDGYEAEEMSLPELWDLENQARVKPSQIQEMLMESIQRNRVMAVEGVAGSGKSMFVLWEARRLASLGKRVAIVCYNELLADSFQRTFKEYGFDDSRVEVHNFAKWGMKYVKLAKLKDVPHKEPKKPEEISRYYEEVLPAGFARALDELRCNKKFANRYFDAVIIDEGQDLRSDWLDAALKLCNNPKASVIRFFYDPRQKLYEGRDYKANKKFQEMPVIVLSKGFRSTKNILEWVRVATGIEVDSYDNTPAGDKVDVKYYRNPEEQIEMLDKCIASLQKRKVALSDILVVSLRSSRSSALKNLDDTRFHWSSTGDKGLTDGRINVVSAYRIKGLDAKVVILTDVMRSSKGPCEPHHMAEQIFVGATRAKSKLIVFREK